MCQGCQYPVQKTSIKQLCVLGLVNQLQSLQECKLMALHHIVQRFAEIVDRVTWVTPEAPQDDDAVNAVATLYHNKAHGKCIQTCICLFVPVFTHPSSHSSVHSRTHHMCSYSHGILLIACKADVQ